MHVLPKQQCSIFCNVGDFVGCAVTLGTCAVYVLKLRFYLLSLVKCNCLIQTCAWFFGTTEAGRAYRSACSIRESKQTSAPANVILCFGMRARMDTIGRRASRSSPGAVVALRQEHCSVIQPEVHDLAKTAYCILLLPFAGELATPA